MQCKNCGKGKENTFNNCGKWFSTAGVVLCLLVYGILCADSVYASTVKERLQERITEVEKIRQERKETFEKAHTLWAKEMLNSLNTSPDIKLHDIEGDFGNQRWNEIAFEINKNKFKQWEAFWPKIMGSPQDEFKKVVLPQYSLAEDFPPDKISVFEDFVALFAFLEEVEKNVVIMYAWEKGRMSPFKESDPTPAQIVNARIESSEPVHYEDFLSAVSMAFPSFYRENLWRSSSYSSFFVQNILGPMSADLVKKEYRGYHFAGENFLQSFSEDMKKPYPQRETQNEQPFLVGNLNVPEYRNPNDLEWIGVYAQTFWNIYPKTPIILTQNDSL
jgi:hypothetical protein